MVATRQARGLEPPDWYLEQPDVEPGDVFYLTAFNRLSTCRSVGMDEGRIPWTAIVQYGKHAGFDDNMCNALVIIIEVMDAAYRKWHNDNRPKGESGQIGNTVKAR